MDAKSPKSEPAKSVEKPNIEKVEKQEIVSKPDLTPKPKNKIERPKTDFKKESKNKIQREKINLLSPSKNKIERPKVDFNKESKNKIQREKVNLLTPSRNKIERPKFDPGRKSTNKIQPQRFTPEISKNKIERIPTSEPKNTSKPEGNQLSMEQIKEEIKKIDWKSISENWTVKVSANKEITLNPYELPSKENPLYKHKQWLQTVYNHKKWNLNDDRLRTISGVSHTTIYKWRKKLDIPTKQNLYNDGKQKECGRCLQIKPHNEFKLRNDIRKVKPYLRSNCNQCKNELNQIYIFKNKHKILTNIYNGKFKEKCPECETKVFKLPAFDFHHLDKNYKLTQRIRTRGNWKKTMERLEQEKTIPLCNSCHLTKKATVFNKFKEIVLRKNNFENNLTGIENNIYQYIKSNLEPEENKHLHQIKSWIKKRIVTERLYKGSCIGCGEKDLSTFQFHHRDPEKKSYRSWTQINFLSISEIMEKLVKDNAICLCGTCHSMVEARHFKENMNEIVGSKNLPELKTFYEKLNRNINNYSFPKELESKVNYRSRIIQNKLAKLKEIETGTPLKESIEYQTAYGEAWKKYLFHINKLTDEGKKVQTKILAENVGVNTRNTRKNIQKLIAKGLISINGEHNNRTILLTEKGKEESKKNYPYIYK
ncbi:MAG: hypothetical protein ACTSO8_05520 [Promethearchaeota archaeon]